MLLADTPPLPPPAPVEITLSAERVAVNDNRTMGLLGLSYQRRFSPQWSGGLTVYGAGTGDRGGFFAWGASGAYHRDIGPWQAEAGLFVGGGGGSPGWVGSGLMLRPHLEVSRDLGPVRLGLGVSRVQFPDGLVRSTQPYVSLRWASDAWLGPAHGGPAPAASATLQSAAAESEYAAVAGVYLPTQAPRRDASGGTGSLQYGGIAFRRTLAGGPVLGAAPYGVITALGAMGGGYDGYAELTGGLGLQWRSAAWPTLALRAEAAAGSAGAGATVDTGGGLVGKVGGAVVWRPLPHLSVAAHAGRLQSRGRFAANEARLELAWRAWDVIPGAVFAAAAGAPAPTAFTWAPWSVSAGWAAYPHLLRDDGTTPSAGLVALKLEREFGPSWRLVGQATNAASGQAGGYAAGHLGAGWLTPLQPDSPWRFGAEATLGAAGGGSVAVNGGLFAQAQLQARYALSPGWALQADVGRLRGLRGELSSPLIGVSLVSSYSRLEGR
ncbi:MAG: hypothetical protein RJA98_4014 [Pseudomonadota bacterium]|jgi:hypothetical protein